MDNGSKFSYVGEVKLRYKKNGKTFEFSNHNEGFESLFKTISALLAGEGFPYGAISYVSLRRFREDSSTTPHTITITPLFTSGGIIPITQQPKSVLLSNGEDRDYACAVTTTISMSDMIAKEQGKDKWVYNTENTTDTAYLYLLSSNKSELARVEISEDSVNSIDRGVQLFIQWNLITNNPSA